MNIQDIKLTRVLKAPHPYKDETVTRWYLPEGTSQELGKVYLVKGYGKWEAWQDNAGRLDECGEQVEDVEVTRYFDYWDIRTKEKVIAIIAKYDENLALQRKEEAEKEAQRQAEWEAECKLIADATENFISPTDADTDCTAKVGDIIQVKLSSWNKQNSMGEVLQHLGGVSPAKVQQVIIMTNKNFDNLARDMFEIPEYLAKKLEGKGGDFSTHPDLEGKTYIEICNSAYLTGLFRSTCHSLVTLVKSPNRKTIVVDPQAYNYIRYAGVVA